MAIRRLGKGLELRKQQKEQESHDITNDLFNRISKLDKSVMVAQHNKIAKQVLESLQVYTKLGLHPWECLTLVEDIMQDVLRKWEVYHQEKK